MPSLSRIRNKVEQLPQDDAIDYLMWQVETLIESLGYENPHPVDKWDLGLTPTERKMLVRLYDVRGGILSKDHLHATIGKVGSDSETESQAVYVLICRIRNKLPRSIGVLKNHFGRGYSLHLEPQPTPA